MTAMIQHDKAAKKFILMKDGKASTLDYSSSIDDQIDGQGHLILDYQSTFVPPELRGQHLGENIVKFALDYARENGYKVIPSCPFVKAYIEKHPEYKDLVSNV